jgi:leucyl aminopeptidase
MQITFNNQSSLDTLIIGLAEDFNLKENLEMDNELKDLISQAALSRNFEGKVSQFASMCISSHSKMKNIILLGLGKYSDFTSLSAAKLGGKIVSTLKCIKLKESSVILEHRVTNENEAEIYANLAYGAHLRNYSFNKYKSEEKLKGKITLKSIEFITNLNKDAEELYTKDLKPVAEAAYFTRDLVSEPANILYPESFVQKTKEDFANLNIKIEALGEKEMHKLGMHALLGVGQGSKKESQLLVMQYNGGAKDEAPLAFVGKGVTFDTGGISLKSSANMEDMKYDMSGAAIVTGLIKALAARKAKVNIVAIAALAENMPDGNAQRPSDVVTSMSGQTIEILNTDAEGRLVLADALWYCQDRFNPKLMIDLATLTGAMVVTLGSHRAGLFSNNEELEQNLMEAANHTEEKLWPFPMDNEYDKMIDSTIADVRNTGNARGAGSITAAQFLKRFVNNVSWAHLDIAGVSWANKNESLHPTGATGFGLRLLNDFVKKYEQ